MDDDHILHEIETLKRTIEDLEAGSAAFKAWCADVQPVKADAAAKKFKNFFSDKKSVKDKVRDGEKRHRPAERRGLLTLIGALQSFNRELSAQVEDTLLKCDEALHPADDPSPLEASSPVRPETPEEDEEYTALLKQDEELSRQLAEVEAAVNADPKDAIAESERQVAEKEKLIAKHTADMSTIEHKTTLARAEIDKMTTQLESLRGQVDRKTTQLANMQADNEEKKRLLEEDVAAAEEEKKRLSAQWADLLEKNEHWDREERDLNSRHRIEMKKFAQKIKDLQLAQEVRAAAEREKPTPPISPRPQGTDSPQTQCVSPTEGSRGSSSRDLLKSIKHLGTAAKDHVGSVAKEVKAASHAATKQVVKHTAGHFAHQRDPQEVAEERRQLEKTARMQRLLTDLESDKQWLLDEREKIKSAAWKHDEEAIKQILRQIAPVKALRDMKAQLKDGHTQEAE